MAEGFSTGYIPPHTRSTTISDKSSVNTYPIHVPVFLTDKDNDDYPPLNITVRKSIGTPSNVQTPSSNIDPPHPVLCAMFDALDAKMNDQLSRLKRMEISGVNTNKALQFTQDNVDDLKKRVNALEEENKSLKNMNCKYHGLTRDLNRRVSDIEQHMAQNDHNMRRRNFLIEGVPVTPGENTLDIVVDIISNIVAGFSHTEIEFAQRVNKPGAKRPILVILKSLRIRDEILKKKQDLKQHSSLKKIWINEDATPTIKKQKNDSRAVTKQATQKGHQAQQRGTGIIIDGKYYPHNKLHKLPGGISLAATRTRVTDTTVGFAGPLAPLSNMHEAPFVHNKTPYRTVEHAHFHIRATEAQEYEIAQQILDTDNAFTARTLGKTIKLPEGQESDVNQLKVLMRKKFLQNPSALQELLNTGTRRILECNWDRKWAAGHGLDSRLFNTEQQPGENLTGIALEELRTEFKDLIAAGKLQLPSAPVYTDAVRAPGVENTQGPTGELKTTTANSDSQPPIPPARTRRSTTLSPKPDPILPPQTTHTADPTTELTAAKSTP